LFLFYSKHKNKVFVIKLGEKTKQNMYLQRTTLKKSRNQHTTIFRMMQHQLLPTKKTKQKLKLINT